MYEANEHAHKEIIIIVSGFATGRYLAPLFRGKGYSCVHVASSLEFQNQRLTTYFNPNDYLENFIIDSESDYNNLLLKLALYKVKLITVGSESGIYIADKLSNIFKTPCNNFELSIARKNKFFMHDTLKQNNISCARQIKSSSITELINWFESNQFKKIVIKPLASGSSDGVFYCINHNEIANAAKFILQNKNFFNEVNNEVLAQEYISGKQYLVNSVTSNAVHYITDIWEEARLNSDVPSNDLFADLVNKDSSIYATLSEYTFSVLNALGIHYGAAHSEIRINENGICLIEIGARLAGKIDPSIIEGVYGYSQVSLLPYSFLDHTLFTQLINYQKTNKKYIRYVYLSSTVEGEVKNEPPLDMLYSIESVVSVCLNIAKGTYLHKTNRALKRPRPGYVYLANDSLKKLKTDYEQLKLIEQDFYLSMM